MRLLVQAPRPGDCAAGARAPAGIVARACARGPGRVRRERLTRAHRLRSSLEIARAKAEGRGFRGAHCVILVHAVPGVPTRIGFVASRRGVGGAVERNRARRRLREIVRRRWPRLAAAGFHVLVIAHRSALTAPHQELATELERLLAEAGVLAPLEGPRP